MPYYPAIADQNDTNEVNIKILEIPNNGLDTFANRPEVMLARFYANYDNEYLVAPRMVSYMSHPQWHEEEFPRMRKVLEAVSQYSWQRDAGPVIFVTHADIYNVWKQ